jgi:hypothetical protein
MKYFTLALFFVSVSALACPRLEGTYLNCSASESGSFLHKVRRITQERVDNATIYAITYADTPVTERTEFYIADGLPHAATIEGPLRSRSVRAYRATCVGRTLELSVSRELHTPISRAVLSEESAVMQRTGLTSIRTELDWKIPGRSGRTTIDCSLQ